MFTRFHAEHFFAHVVLIVVVVGVLTMTSTSVSADPPLSEVGRWVDPPCAPNHPTGTPCSDWSWVFSLNPDVHFSPEDAFLTPDGKVFVRWRCGARQYLWDPTDGSFTQKNHNAVGVDVAGCPGLAAMPDGRIMVAGGVCGSANCDVPNATPYVDWAAAYDFKSNGGTWSQLAPMLEDRWYPTITALPDGNMLATGGRTGCNPAPPSGNPSVYNTDNNSWSEWNGTPISTLFGSNQVNYPRVFVTTHVPDHLNDPNWRVLVIPARAQSGNNNMDHTYLLDLASESWTLVDIMPWSAGRTGDVMYLPNKVLRAGGRLASGAATDMAMTLDLTDSGKWEVAASMHHARDNHDLVMLPNGYAVAIGGEFLSVDKNQEPIRLPVFEAEWIDPTEPMSNQVWEELAAAEFPRVYHSVALLLPDATVLAAGGRTPDGQPGLESNAEIFEPPYLFDGNDYAPRPAIQTAPISVPYGSAFCIQLAETEVNVEDIARVNLIRTGAVTHGFDANQRFVPLTIRSIDESANRLTVWAPRGASYAPPGYYMLFVVSDTGVPSVAKFIQLGETNCPGCFVPCLSWKPVSLDELLRCWGEVTDPECESADIDGNGIVDEADLVKWLDALGS